MTTQGPLLAAGRDADIYEYGPGLVLRRSRAGRSLADEARIMEYLSTKGYPVPALEAVLEDGAALVMERVQGVSMVEALGRRPWTVRHQGDVLAELHAELHALEAPDFLAPAPLGHGARILHLDLHPLNVLVGPKGPVVIDWTGATRGDPDVDVALAWVLMTAGQIPGGGVKARVLGLGRQLLVSGFIRHFDRKRVATKLREVVTWKVKDPHMSEAEVRAMWDLADSEEGAS